jgi:hypothetical protein
MFISTVHVSSSLTNRDTAINGVMWRVADRITDRGNSFQMLGVRQNTLVNPEYQALIKAFLAYVGLLGILVITK